MAINRRPNQQDLSWFIDLNKQRKLNLDPPYQRKSVWLPKDKRFFLNTIFNNYPCPAIYLQKQTDESYSTTYNVVDGKQRLMTVIDFYDGKLRLSDDYGDNRLDNKKWSEIQDDDFKKQFLNYQFTVETLDSIDYEGWNTVFDRLNRNAKTLSNQELRHARFDGWLVNRAELEAEFPLWKEIKISSTSKARRMKDVEFISILMLVILEEKIVGFPQSALDILYAKYEVVQKDNTEDAFFEQNAFNVDAESTDDQIEFDEQVGSYEVCEEDLEEFEAKFTSIKEFIRQFNISSELLTTNKVFGARRTTHLYTLWTYLALKTIPSDVEEFKNKYEKFFTVFEQLQQLDISLWADLKIPNVKLVIDYLNNSSGASTEEPQRKGRLEALAQYMAA